MSVTSAWVGGVTQSVALVKGKVVGSSVRLAVSTNSNMSGAVYFGPATSDAQGVATVRATDLAADDAYFFALEVDGTLDTTFPGRFRTFPVAGEAASFAFAAASCAGLNPEVPGVAGARTDLLSNNPVFDTIRTHGAKPVFFCHLGDMAYYNPGQIVGSTVDDYRGMWDDILLQPRQHQLYRNVPLVYIWDDHDFGPDNSDSTSPGRANAQQVYREKVPSYDLPDTGDAGIYHSFQIGRVLFIAADGRSDRSPDDDPDGPDKTLLGAAQKAWMRQVLTASDAKALVWLQQNPWIETGRTDMWSSFATERAELADMFTSLGWADRMIMLNGDTHAMGFDTGADNPYGGFPVYVCSPLDSSTMGKAAPYDVGFNSARRQYGVFQITDDGTVITIEAQGYRDLDLLFSHRIQIDTTPPAPPPPPKAPGIAKRTVTWLACDLVTGDRIAELPEITGVISRVMGAYTSCALTLPIPLAGPGALPVTVWEPATQPGHRMLVPVINDTPSIGLIVLTRSGGTDGVLQLGTASLEAYLDRRYVTDHNYFRVDQASIAAGLLGDAGPDGIGLIIDAPATGTTRDRSYVDTDDATVYSRLRELAGVDGGIDWTIDVDWADTTRTGIVKIARIRARLGTANPSPNAVFASRGGSDATYTYTEDYSRDKGANHVIATSTGEGVSRPQSNPSVGIATGWPRFDERFTPSTSITTGSVLDEHATSELALKRDGARTLEITSRWDQFPRLNIDYALGDDVAWDLIGHRHPAGFTGVGRVIGWSLDLKAGTLTPTLWQPGQDTGGS